MINCDYCRCEFERTYSQHINMKESRKDYCRKCIQTKNIEDFLYKINFAQVDELVEYIVNTKTRKISGIYSIKNKINNKLYIGSSKDIINRFKSHIDEINRGTHYCNDFKYIDIANLEFSILEYDIEDSKLLDLEYYYINLLGTNKKNIGYNVMSKRKKELSMSTGDNGSKVFSLKLTVNEVKVIKKELTQGTSLNVIAEKFNISDSTVYSIKNCDIWKDVLPELNNNLKSINYKSRTKGEFNGSSKLTEDQVKEIKSILNSGSMTMTDIGKKFNVSRTLIGHIKRGKLWTHVV